MKKLMVLLAAVALAMGVNAAAVDWQVSYAGKGSTWKDSSVVVYAFSGSDYASIISLVTETGSDTLKADLQAKALNKDVAFITNRKGTAKTDITRANSAPDSMFWMIFTDGSFDAGKNVAWTAATDVKSAQYEPPATGSTFALNAASFANSGTIASVPEPTSGLLLLIGMAGLALKRKRA